MPSSAGVNSSSAPSAPNIARRSSDIEVGIVEPVFAERSPLESLHHFLHVSADEAEDGADLEGIVEHFGLSDISTGDNAVPVSLLVLAIGILVVGVDLDRLTLL
jgi:hypothetical protein